MWTQIRGPDGRLVRVVVVLDGHELIICEAHNGPDRMVCDMVRAHNLALAGAATRTWVGT